MSRLDPQRLLGRLQEELIAVLQKGSSLDFIKPGAKLSAMVETLSASAALRDYETLTLGTEALLEIAWLGHIHGKGVDEAVSTWENVLLHLRDLGVAVAMDARAAEIVMSNLDHGTRYMHGGMTGNRIAASHVVFQIGQHAARQRFEAVVCTAVETLTRFSVFDAPEDAESRLDWNAVSEAAAADLYALGRETADMGLTCGTRVAAACIGQILLSPNAWAGSGGVGASGLVALHDIAELTALNGLIGASREAILWETLVGAFLAGRCPTTNVGPTLRTRLASARADPLLSSVVHWAASAAPALAAVRTGTRLSAADVHAFLASLETRE